MRRLLGWILCLIGDHNWTSDAERGIPPDPVRIKADPLGYFRVYSRMYCKRCSKVSRAS